MVRGLTPTETFRVVLTADEKLDPSEQTTWILRPMSLEDKIGEGLASG